MCDFVINVSQLRYLTSMTFNLLHMVTYMYTVKEDNDL